jgi:predicted permease
LVSGAVQSTAGLLTGILVYGCALSGIFSLVFAYAYARVGRLSPRATAAMVAALGFATLIVVPQIKYPAHPPSIGEPDTIAARTALYFTMVALSAIAAVAAISPHGNSPFALAYGTAPWSRCGLSRRDNRSRH